MTQEELKQKFKYVLEKYNDVLLSLRNFDNQFTPGACEDVLKAYGVLMAMEDDNGQSAAIRQRVDDKAPLGNQPATAPEAFGSVWSRTVYLIEEYKKQLGMETAVETETA